MWGDIKQERALGREEIEWFEMKIALSTEQNKLIFVFCKGSVFTFSLCPVSFFP